MFINYEILPEQIKLNVCKKNFSIRKGLFDFCYFDKAFKF